MLSLLAVAPSAAAAPALGRTHILDAQQAAFGVVGPAGRPPASRRRSGRRCPGADASPARSRRVLRRALVCLVNVERRRAGVRAVRSDTRLRRTALAHADDMVRRRYFRHDSLDGRTFLDRIVARRYAPRRAGFLAGENLAWGLGRFGTPRAVVRAWMASPSHRRVLLLPAFRDVGVGVRRGAPVPVDGPAASYVANFGAWGSRRLR